MKGNALPMLATIVVLICVIIPSRPEWLRPEPSMICIHNVVAVSSTTEAVGNEGKIISMNILPCAIYVVLVLAVYLIFG